MFDSQLSIARNDFSAIAGGGAMFVGTNAASHVQISWLRVPAVRGVEPGPHDVRVVVGVDVVEEVLGAAQVDDRDVRELRAVRDLTGAVRDRLRDEVRRGARRREVEVDVGSADACVQRDELLRRDRPRVRARRARTGLPTLANGLRAKPSCGRKPQIADW